MLINLLITLYYIYLLFNLNKNKELIMEQNQFHSMVEQLVSINHIKKIKLEELQLNVKIGEGGQAKVFKGLYEGNQVAVKVLQNIDFKCFAHELVIIAYLEHPNIPKFYGIVFDKGILSLVFEFIDGKTLDEYKPNQFTNEQKYKMIYDLSSILEYIHKNKFIHRDLKPENLMIDKNGKTYLIDFGIAKVCTTEDYTKTRAKGTVNYLAPECLDPSDIDEEQIISKITTKIDVWAFGCIVSWLFSGFLPWCDKYKDNAPIIQKVLSQKIPFSIPNNITDNVIRNIIQMATKVNIDERSSMADIKVFIENNLINKMV